MRSIIFSIFFLFISVSCFAVEDATPTWYAWQGWSYYTYKLNSVINDLDASIDGNVFTDAFTIDYYDNDDYQYSYQHEAHGLAVRAYTNPTQWTYKDIIGFSIYADSTTYPYERGVSGVTALVSQHGRGIASNEFFVKNPSDSNAAAASMAAIQAVVEPQVQDADSTHHYVGILTEMRDMKATAAIEAKSVPTDLGDGAVMTGIDLSQLKIAPGGAAIRLAQDSQYSEGTVIEFDTNDYMCYDRLNNVLKFVIDGKVVFEIK